MTKARLKRRCAWANPESPVYLEYHDNEWGRPAHDDRLLFEMLCLEGAQAGLSWETILKKRDGYRSAFANFDVRRLARFTDERLEELLLDPAIVRNRLKVWSVRSNARAFLEVQKELGSFDRYLWEFIGGAPIKRDGSGQGIPARTELSDRLSRDLQKRGFKFVGSTIMYAFMQAVGVVNDHSPECFLSGG